MDLHGELLIILRDYLKDEGFNVHLSYPITNDPLSWLTIGPDKSDQYVEINSKNQYVITLFKHHKNDMIGLIAEIDIRYPGSINKVLNTIKSEMSISDEISTS